MPTITSERHSEAKSKPVTASLLSIPPTNAATIAIIPAVPVMPKPGTTNISRAISTTPAMKHNNTHAGMLPPTNIGRK